MAVESIPDNRTTEALAAMREVFQAGATAREIALMSAAYSVALAWHAPINWRNNIADARESLARAKLDEANAPTSQAAE